MSTIDPQQLSTIDAVAGIDGRAARLQDCDIWPMMSATMAGVTSPDSDSSGPRREAPRRGPMRGWSALLTALWVILLAALLTTSVVAVESTEEDAPSLDTALIAEALDILGERYVDGDALTTENLTAGAIRGMVEALGDEGHTEYLTPEEYSASQDALEGRVIGIGVVLDQRSRMPLIISVIDGSPADRVGMRAGDVIATVDGLETARLPLDALAELVRGQVGTTVRIGIERPGLPELLEFPIVREDVQIAPASWARVPDSDVAVVRIVQFSVATGHRTREAIEAAIESGATGIVLDLRGNPGGLVDEALDVASAFLDGGVAYQEQGRVSPARDVAIPTGRTIAPDIPLIVLVDYATASSAEILAAALRDNGRAAVVGEQTYGTGTVLNTFDLSDGSALRVGILWWLTSQGEQVFRVGIAPDHEVDAVPGAVLLRPADVAVMTPAEFTGSEDLPLRRAVGLLAPAPR